MRTVIYSIPQKKWEMRKLKPKLPKYLIKRKILIIREKIITRKYGIIYLQKVFGVYYPSECRRYYRKKMLRRFFEKLKTHWFEKKKVYRLLHRADIFFHEKLIRKSFNVWRFYAVKSKIIKQQAHIVRYNYNVQLLKTTLSSWKTITDLEKKFKQVRDSAIELYNLMYTLLLLLNLGKYFCDETEENLLQIKSVLCGRFIILRKYTKRWKLYTIQQRNDKILKSRAESYNRFKIILLYFTHWQRYVCYRRMKCEIFQVCTGLYEDGLLKLTLQLWKNKTKARITERKYILLATTFYDNLIKCKLLKTWQRYVKHKLVGRNLKHKATFFYIMRLKQKILSALSRNVTRCKNRKLAIQKLKLFYRRLLILTIWNKWIMMIDEKNDSDLGDKWLLSTFFHEKNIVKKYLTKWIYFKTSQQKRKTLNSKIIDLCTTFYCKKFFTMWIIVYRTTRRVAILEEQAQEFLNDSVIRNAFSLWIKSYNSAICMKAKYQKSVLHYEKKITSKYFASWINFCNKKIKKQNLILEAREYYLEMLKRNILKKLSMNVKRKKVKQQKIKIAENLYKTNLTIKVFVNWREYCLYIREVHEKVRKFNQSMQNKLKLKIIAQWKLYLHIKKWSSKKTLISVTHYRNKICSKTFYQWKKYLNYRKMKKIHLSYLRDEIEKIKLNVITIYFQYWRRARLYVLREKCKIFHVDEFYASHLKKKYFFLWGTFLIQHKTKRQYKNNLNQMINNFILKNYLKIWYAKYQELLKIHFNEDWATKIYEMKILHRYFIVWKYFYQIRMRKKKEINNAIEIRKKLVIKEGLQHLIELFLCNIEPRIETQKKNIETNFLPKYELLKKYFNRWYRTTFSKNRRQLKVIRGQRDFGHDSSTNPRLNDGSYVYNLIPRFMIPEFMKDEIKLDFGIESYSSKVPVNINRMKILTDRISKTCDSYNNQKFSKNNSFPHNGDGDQDKKYFSHQLVHNQPKIKDELENYPKYLSNTLMRSQNLKSTSKENLSTISYLPSPDSFKSDSDSAKTYTVKNPMYCKNLSEANLFDNELPTKGRNEENIFKLIPPAAFHATVNKF